MFPLLLPLLSLFLSSQALAEPDSTSTKDLIKEALNEKNASTKEENEVDEDSDTGEPEEPTTEELLGLIDKSVFDLPMVYNGLVLYWVNHFSNEGRWTASKWIRNSGKYRNLIQSELKKAGLPRDLLYMVMIESGFDPIAESSASAVGIWQFIPNTGKTYGLTINEIIDERRDPIRSTQAAIAYLKKLYLEFGNWHLAIAAYNAGENRIYKAINQHGTINYWELCQKEALAKETINYVPKILALSILDRNAKLFGVPSTEKRVKPLNAKIALADRNQHVQTLADAAEMELEEFLEFNPHILASRLLVAESDIIIYLPPQKSDVYLKNIKRTNVSRASSGRSLTEEELAQLPPEVKEKPNLEHKRVFHHIVKKDETWESIAKKHAISTEELKIWNNNELKIEKKISLQKPRPRQFVQHTVKSGESLRSIAKKYQCSIADLITWNGLEEDAKIKKGDQLWIK